MRTDTDHQSFMLKPSIVSKGGVGVFVLHDVAKDARLALFTDDFQEEIRDAKDVPEDLQGFCLNRADGKLICPKSFSRMDIGNYVNHSDASNMRWDEGKKSYFARRDIKAGEELLADYRELGEPENSREDYYR